MSTQTKLFLSLAEIEARVCDMVAEHTGIERSKIHPRLELIADLHIDSIDFLDLMLTLERTLNVDMSERDGSAFKAVFTRQHFCLRDLAELAYLSQHRPAREHRFWKRSAHCSSGADNAFTQLGGVFHEDTARPLYDLIKADKSTPARHRRITDGMICIPVPLANVSLGSDTDSHYPDEAPVHLARVDSFLMDAEPVSTTAYARFLNSIEAPDAATLHDWFILDPQDKRRQHALLHHDGQTWQPVAGTERLPMMLVSWYGANAYSLWANLHDWRQYRAESAASSNSFLPTEAQWEYAARGSEPRKYPWGNDEPTAEHMRYGQYSRGVSYTIESLPMAAVNEELGISPFGLRHMAGNVWQWCRDWYSPEFYASPSATSANPVNVVPSGIRSERGGSWVGPAFLCRSSYRRGRAPHARGRCLGFRCVGDPRRTLISE